ncbi:hypothetical protein UlMin_008743 [Ulmus minor]
MAPPKETISSTSSTTPSPAEELIPGLPYDIALNCLSRVPRSHHPVLSAVSKPIKSLLSSPHLFTTRSLHNFTENLIYIIVLPKHALYFTFEPQPLLFAFHRKPNNNYKENASHFVPIPPCPSKLWGSSYATLGSKIYVIGGGLLNSLPTTEVWILDCRLHTWERGPSMRVPRLSPSVVVFEGKIYVIAGRRLATPPVEVFDPAIGRWEVIPSPIDLRDQIRSISNSFMIGGGLIGITYNTMVVLDTTTRTWRKLPESACFLGPTMCSTCSVDGIVYGCDKTGAIYGLDTSKGEWKRIKMMLTLLGLYGFKIIKIGGRSLMLWATYRDATRKEKYWFAEIEVEKVGEGDFKGRVLLEEELQSPPLVDNGGDSSGFPVSVSL